jgi:hypothetical protein
MRDETAKLIDELRIRERIEENVLKLRVTLELLRLVGHADDDSERRAAFVSRALDLIESQSEKMLEVYAARIEATFSPEETLAVIKYRRTEEELDACLQEDMRALFKPLLPEYGLDDPDATYQAAKQAANDSDKEHDGKIVYLDSKRKTAFNLFGLSDTDYDA